MTTKRLALALLILTSLAALAAGCSAPDSGQGIEFKVSVFAREVGTGTVEDLIVATGSLRAPETVSLRADTGGELRIAVGPNGRRLGEGDRVVVGAVVAQITGQEVKLAARTEATQQRYRAAQRDYDQKKSLYGQGLISELEFRPVETELATAKIEWEQSVLTESRSHLTTPLEGVILMLARGEDGLPMADGQLVNQGFVVAQIAPTDALIADVDLVGPDVSRVEEGLRARIRHHAWDGQEFEGVVIRLAPSIDPATRTLRAEIAIDNSDRKLRPGMFTEVTIVAERHEEVLVVSRDAVTERAGVKVVFVVNGQRVAQREVVLGFGDDEVVEIKSGLEAGDRVVVRGLETLSDGTRVRVSGA